VLPLADGSVLVVIGDVMGRGVAAAIVMGQVRAALRAYALLDPDPVLVLTRLDRLVATLGVPEQIVTVLAGVISPDRSVIRLACAGHLPPVLTAPGAAARLVVVPEDPRAAASARQWLRRLLDDWRVPADVADDATTCLSEVVTNAVIHAGSGARVAAEIDEGRLLVSVVDTGRRGSAQRRDLATDEIRGRGLAVVEALATAWSADRRSDGTLVWFEFDLG
jgi:anti-sigma regulatory factor (Ser/Thr protein kinase)